MANDTETDNDAGELVDDFPGMFMDGLCSIPLFTILISFVLYILLDTNVFNEKILANIPDTVESGCKTGKGVIITGILFGLLIAIIEAFHAAELI